jgi:two-component system, sensor histidine kinase PdtaS
MIHGKAYKRAEILRIAMLEIDRRPSPLLHWSRGLSIKRERKTKLRRTGTPFEHSISSYLPGSDSSHPYDAIACGSGMQAYRFSMQKNDERRHTRGRGLQESIEKVISTSRAWLFERSQGHINDLSAVSLLNASTDCIQVLSRQGSIEFINDCGLSIFQIADFSEVEGMCCADLWVGDQRKEILQALERATRGEAIVIDGICEMPVAAGKWWDISVLPVRGADGQVMRIVLMMRDVSERHEKENAFVASVKSLEARLGDSAMMMKDVHHQVRNSLQLVQSLLELQASLSGNEIVAMHLTAAALRTHCIGALHRRLYQDEGAISMDVSTYLKGLMADFAKLTMERKIVVEGACVLPPERLASIGLVTAELVTNALKHGRGTVRVRMEQVGEFVILAVEDEGDGFPSDFLVSRKSGLGMRLVVFHAGKTEDAVWVDRSVPFGRIVVRFLGK